MPPFGHTTYLSVFSDPALLQYDEVWAAAGTWHDVFGIEPHEVLGHPQIGITWKEPRKRSPAQGRCEDLCAGCRVEPIWLSVGLLPR